MKAKAKIPYMRQNDGFVSANMNICLEAVDTGVYGGPEGT